MFLGSYGLGATELTAPGESRSQGHWHLVPWCGCALTKVRSLGRTQACFIVYLELPLLHTSRLVSSLRLSAALDTGPAPKKRSVSGCSYCPLHLLTVFSLTCPAVPLERELPGPPLGAFPAGLGLDPKLLNVLPEDAGLALGLPLALH